MSRVFEDNYFLGIVEFSIDQVSAEKNSCLTTKDGALLLAQQLVESGGWNERTESLFQFQLRSEEDWEKSVHAIIVLII